jgi:transcriptional regulator with XRE-family HTH domain
MRAVHVISWCSR